MKRVLLVVAVITLLRLSGIAKAESFLVQSKDGANSPYFATYTVPVAGTYLIEASGTYQYAQGAGSIHWADAGWATWDNWATTRAKIDGSPILESPSGPLRTDVPGGVLMLWFKEETQAFAAGFHDWGDYNPAHIYSTSRTLTAGQQLTFWICDWYPYSYSTSTEGGQWYYDNAGAITVKVERQQEETPSAITANVLLLNWVKSSNTTIPFCIQYRKSGSTETPNVVNVNLVVKPNGEWGMATFTLSDLSLGVYDVSVKCNNWLARKLTSIDVTAGDSTGNEFALKNGDINSDNVVNFSDYLILQTQYKKSPGTPSADLNGDGAVNFSDYLVMQANYKKVGDAL